MDFSTLFRTKENLNLDKNTLTILRYIAIFGQFFAINFVFFYLKLEFPIIESYIIVFLGLATNFFLQFKIRVNQLKDTYASFFLLYDLIQLSALLYLTGGILNPFSFLLIIPAIVSSTFLSMGTTIILGVITSFMLFLLGHFYIPLPGMDETIFYVPNFYKFGLLTSILIGLIFLSYFGIRFSGETKKRSEALNKLQEVIAKEYVLESLGGQAAAAAHSLGTPLATISVVAKELKKEIGNNKEISKDVDLLISQIKRCSEILKQISKKQIKEDNFLSSIRMEDLLEEIINSFRETSSKHIDLLTDEDQNKINIQRTPELIYGLRNFIGNAIKFSKSKVQINLKSNDKIIEIKIYDDGPGIPEDIINKIGEPYIKSKSKELSSNSGLGLGTFLGKTLLERQGAILKFKRNSKLGGAQVTLSWIPNNFIYV
ncbi:ActS/PrrB/RegB family redox-sensitive histidine kinase [Candidatus Pelagibacter bacterium]|nr:ActS/PrrB/RegB family redox-sensitive histidine kinase [Candidatus Pelagibacter bacterium]MDA8676596.1 ActS/PrrB/RegB family redox-sensitive histidine kinase [Candidatus Pelagibacter bacterium]MDA8764303.1 ActS/PrrB/RegB family redox-sensitive histidine kinase [Candidatus Pelagibacter bacterium]MDA8772602.1 ActS/PrrB/RegB family redox-sensitive histidine kinase [Candidatus Pelagibacter bacterium]